MGGGTHAAIRNLATFFQQSDMANRKRMQRPFAACRMRVALAFENAVHVPERAAVVIVALARALLQLGCDVVFPVTSSLLASKAFASGIMNVASVRKVSVGFAEQDGAVGPNLLRSARSMEFFIVIVFGHSYLFAVVVGCLYSGTDINRTEWQSDPHGHQRLS